VAAGGAVEIPPLEEAVNWSQVPAGLRSWARVHTLYDPLWSDLNVPEGGPLYPNYYDFADLLAAGRQPLYLVRALLDRRFEGVVPFDIKENNYTSAFGKWEEHYLWKLNAVIAARYVAEPGLPAGVLARRPGPEQAGWMRDCFGPFSTAGASLRIRHGGGFWCSFAPAHLSLVATPSRLSEVVTTTPVGLAGAIAVSLRRGPSSRVSFRLGGGAEGVWSALVATTADARYLRVTTHLRGVSLGGALVPAAQLSSGRLSIELKFARAVHLSSAAVAAPSVVVAPTPPVKSIFSITATPGVEVGLGAARLTL
jgi:hypothetical protein